MNTFSEMLTLEEYHREMLRVVHCILDSNIGIVVGARELTQLLSPLGLDDDPDALTFRGIDSETNHLPLGEVRRRWSVEALKVKDDELHCYEAQVRHRAFRACEGLILRYEHADYSGKTFAPHVVGVGVALAVEDGALKIVRVLPGTPADKAGLSLGLIVQKIDSTAIDPNNPKTWIRKLRGEPGTKVQVELIDTVQDQPYTVELRRKRII